MMNRLGWWVDKHPNATALIGYPLLFVVAPIACAVVWMPILLAVALLGRYLEALLTVFGG
jgi:hypothetical protein